MTTRQDPGTRLADELSLLIAAVAERAGPWLDRVALSTHGEHETPAPCQWCPLCSLIAVLRGEPSELAAAGIDRVADVIALLRAVLADRWEPGEPHMPGFRPRQEYTPPPPPRPSPRVQRIVVRRKGTT